ncbi:MAG: Tad domain-containing protein [Blastocatellia bacterium]
MRIGQGSGQHGREGWRARWSGWRLSEDRSDTRARTEKGTILALTAVLVTTMLGMVALSIDLGYAFSARSQLQNGVDSAALAGASALRATIESAQSMPHQAELAREMAVMYASYNQVRRYADPAQGSSAPNSNRLILDPGQVTIEPAGDIPQLRAVARVELSLLFAGIFGLSSVSIQSATQASLFPVDGGTGTCTSCWRPIMIPDSYFDSTGTVRYVGDPLRVNAPLPNQTGDYYRSRFAAGARNTAPYVDSLNAAGSSVTGLRDTSIQSEVGSTTMMGMYLQFRRNHYRIADLTALPRATFANLAIGDQANFGYCGEIRVGDLIPVLSADNASAYENVRIGLTSLRIRNSDTVNANELMQYKFVRSNLYPAPNSHALIIPVLLFNPFELIRNPGSLQLRVTNFGLFYLQGVTSDGTLQGYFVREVVAGGTPIASTNFDGDQMNLFRRSWLPMSTQLIE